MRQIEKSKTIDPKKTKVTYLEFLQKRSFQANGRSNKLGAKEKEKIRLVLDTNVWVSIILRKTLASELLPLIRDKSRIEVYLSQDLVSELARVLTPR